jgi:alginate O-acetyltransferase complex protein AlgI
MVFSSITFLFLYLPLVLLLHFAAPRAWRNGILLAASLFFYAWGEPLYVLVMLLSIAANFAFGLRVADTRTPAGARAATALSVAFNLALLIAFKYANFLADNLNLLLNLFGVPVIRLGPVHLPIGISFFTFQAMSYVIDVHRRHAPPQRSPTALALYISLFPQLIAGPIVRYADIAAEIARRSITREGFADGIRVFIIGLGKKVLVANILAQSADAIFALDPGDLSARVAWLGLFFYGMQLYFDFSGYSDMAIGLGRMLGFHFLPNFNYPYISRSITELWRRWHISLSSWLRDYLYIPLGGNRAGRTRTYLNLMIVFLLCGLWHGASWNFVLWGACQGAFLIGERLFRATERPLFRSGFGVLYANLAFFISLALFRSETLTHAAGYFRALAGIGGADPAIHPAASFVTPEILLAGIAAVAGATPLPAAAGRRLLARPASSTVRACLREGASVTALALVLVLCTLKLASGTHNPFIYFRF